MMKLHKSLTEKGHQIQILSYSWNKLLNKWAFAQVLRIFKDIAVKHIYWFPVILTRASLY